MRLSKAEGDRSPAHLHRSLTLELVRVTERAAIAAAEWRGKGNEQAADQAAVTAMKDELDSVAISGPLYRPSRRGGAGARGRYRRRSA
jgi:fructose-1,6-bisphosphatase II / sedoheptulose-1,7-bisphosphatase